MLRHLMYSIAGHALVLGLLVFPAFLQAKPRRIETVYTVQALSPSDIQNMVNKTAPAGKPKPKLPQQAQVKEDRVLPKENWRPRQTVKKSSPESGESTTTETKTTKSKTPVSGIQVDSEFDYPDYLLTLRAKIERNWRPPTLRVPLKTRVFFRIDRNGAILRTFVEDRTGSMPFDLSAMNAVTKSAPFDPLPSDYPGDEIGIHMDFIYQP